MAQPTGQVLVDSGHALAGTLFAYANDTGLWNAAAGAMLTKTGAGAVVNEGGVNLATSDGSTYFTLASALTTSGDGTFTWRARKAAGATDNAGVVWGNHANVANMYCWMRTSEIRLGGSVLGSNSSVGTLATYSLVRTAGKGRLYKNGAFVNEIASIGNLSTLYVMQGLPSSSTYWLNGAVEFFHAAIGKAFSDAEVAAFHADPYQILQASAGTDATASGVTVSAVSSLLSGSVSGGVSGTAVGATITAAVSVLSGSASGGAGSSIALTSPVPYNLRQRNAGAGTASVTIAGTSTATSAIEYRRGTGAWQTLVASHPGGAYSVAVTLSTGQGDLQVRHASDTAVTASVALATVGDAFMAIGQSNNVGVSPEVVPPVPGAFTALQYDRADAWKPLQEGSTQAASFDGGTTGSKGSYFGALSNRLQANGVPVAFIPAAVGSTTIADWQRYAPLPTALSTLYGRALTQWNEMGGGRAAILWQGESDASSGTTKAAYKAGLHAVIDGWWTDTGTPVFLVLITNFHANAPMIREAQMEVIAESAHVIGWADGGGAYTGDVHYLTATQINAVADAIYTPFVNAFYGTDSAASGSTIPASSSLIAGSASGQSNATASGSSITATASLLAGAASGSGSATASGITLEAVAALLAGIAAGGSTAPGTTLSASDSLIAGNATGNQSGTAAGAVIAVLATIIGGTASNGSIIWPTTRAGEAATARVPFDGVRVIVPDADDPAAPVKALPLYLADTERVLFDFDAKYLPGAGDTAATLLAVDAPAGLLATPDLPVGSALTSGVVALAITPATTAGTYRLQVQIRTTGGRECTGWLDVLVSDTLQPAKTFRLRSTADRDVFDLDFEAKYLAGAADEAASLLGVTADAGLTADARLDVGGVVQVAVDNPTAAGTYQVRTQLLTAAGRRKTGAIAVEVLT